MFFSLNKSANNIFTYDFSAKRDITTIAELMQDPLGD
jgi:hypothetical protein